MPITDDERIAVARKSYKEDYGDDCMLPDREVLYLVRANMKDLDWLTYEMLRAENRYLSKVKRHTIADTKVPAPLTKGEQDRRAREAVARLAGKRFAF